jgi:hypothetical protein
MARISYAARKSLPKSEFALPGKKTAGNPAGKGGYPIDTPNRARNALARAAQHASPAEEATIRRKVHAKFPSIGREHHMAHNRPRTD